MGSHVRNAGPQQVKIILLPNWNFVINYFDTMSLKNFFWKLNTNEIELNHLKKIFYK